MLLRAFRPDLLPEQPGHMTISEMVDAYLASTAKRQSPAVFAERRRLLDLFCADFGETTATAIKRFQVEDWIAKNQGWKSDWTIKRVLGTLQTVFSWAAKGDRIEKNPIAGLSHPQGKRGRPLTIEEFQCLLRSTTPTFRRVLLFLRFSGARPCELSRLEWSMIDFDRHCIVLHEHKSARSRKDHAPRTIALHPIVIRLLLWLCRRQKPGQKFVFLNSRGRTWSKNALGLRVARIRERVGLSPGAVLYGTRHLFGSQCILNGVDLKILSELMGHTTTRMTEHYVHIAGATSHLQAALGKAFGTGKPPEDGKK
jgi:integrase